MDQYARIVFNAISALFAILILVALLKPDFFPFLRDKGTNFPSLGRQGQYVAMIVSTWGFMWLTIHDKMTEWFFVGYMFAWAGAQYASLRLKALAPDKPKPPAEEVKP